MTYHPNRFGAHWGPRALSIVLAATALLVGAASTAEAHNILVSTSPADGSKPTVVPAQVTLTFDQPALAVGTILIVTGPAGQDQTGAAALVNNAVTEQLRPGSPAGRYTVAWRVTSADGHPVSGQFSFTAMSPSPGKQATPATSATATTSTPAGTVTTASTGGHASTLWWVVAVGVVALLLLVVFIVTRKPRTTPRDERDPTA